jgi:hypothetical protein
VACAYAALFWTALGTHPALASAGKLSAQARSLASDAGALRRKLELLMQFDPLAALAMAALEICAIYICLHLLCVLSRRPRAPASGAPPGPKPGRTVRLLAAALLGHAAGCAAAFFGGDAARYYLGCSGALAVFLGIALWLDRPPAERAAEPGARGGSRREIWRTAITALAGAGLVFASSPLDTMAALLSGSPLFPEAWHPLSVMCLSGESAGALFPSAGLLFLAVLAVERWQGQGGEQKLPEVLSSAPAYAFLLGPSSPFKAMAAAFVLTRLGRLGSSALERSLFVLLTVAIPIFLVTRSGS